MFRGLLHNTSDQHFLVTIVETTFVHQAIYKVADEEIVPVDGKSQTWDCSGFLDDKTGVRLFEELQRRTKTLISGANKKVDAIAISLPGTLNGETKVVRSTRLGIYDPIDIGTIFRQKQMPPAFVFHDTECLALGEAIHGALRGADIGPKGEYNFAYIYLDEGIGLTVFINGRAHKGNGSAGHLGRLVMAPSGQYNPVFRSHGALEVFAARPWVSSNIVQQFLALDGKAGQEHEGDRSFRSAVLTASEKQESWTALSYTIIARGLAARDQLAVTVLEEAAIQLGLAINCVITVVNPPAIVLGGGMISNLPGFYDRVVFHTRRFSWTTAWNRTLLRAASLNRDAELLGAVEMLRRTL